MLLRYVTSYVAKCHDNQMSDALYSNHVTPFQAANRYLGMITPLEPEMGMALTEKHIAYTCRRTKITCPDTQGVATMSSHDKYKQRKPALVMHNSQLSEEECTGFHEDAEWRRADLTPSDPELTLVTGP